MTVRLSDRLMALAALVRDCDVLADVGTDHGYLPIYLIQQGKIKSAVAMDINEGPLRRAGEHIAQAGLSGLIDTRLSDGVAALKCGEVDAILIAGMGGALMMRIMSDGESVMRSAKEIILQPQSQIPMVRRSLRETGYSVAAEDIVCEDGKYYPMMRVIPGRNDCDDAAGNIIGSCDGECSGDKIPADRIGEDVCDELYFRYGRLLLGGRHPVLLDYLKWERGIYEGIRAKLKGTGAADGVRMEEVCDILDYNKRAMDFYDYGDIC